jgi:hypothetical protein
VPCQLEAFENEGKNKLEISKLDKNASAWHGIPQSRLTLALYITTSD